MVGGPQLLIILVVALVLFGGKKLPELARGLGQAKKEFETGLAEGGAADPTDPTPETAKPADDA
jgi:sec-independent protein translocase protein TatA